jgi:hypothetical protein
MADTTSIQVTTTTGDNGTEASVYLGICGREFNLDTDVDNFRALQVDSFTFGGPFANVTNREFNDPQHPQLDTDNLPGAGVSPLDEFPVWIRSGQEDDWDIADILVVVNPGRDQVQFRASQPKRQQPSSPSAGKSRWRVLLSDSHAVAPVITSWVFVAFGESGMALLFLLLPPPSGRVVARLLRTTAGTRADSFPPACSYLGRRDRCPTPPSS